MPKVSLSLLTNNLDLCRGGSSFNELKFLKDIRINNGLVLVNRLTVLFRMADRAVLENHACLCLHLLCMLKNHSMRLKLGFFTNVAITTKIEDIIERPPEENITAYSFIKQPFLHKALASISYEQRKEQKKNKKVPIMLTVC